MTGVGSGRHGHGANTPCAVGIVVYNPDPSVLIALLRATMQDAAVLLLYRNSALPDDVERFLSDEPTCTVICLGDGSNPGLGTAYNAIMASAAAQGLAQVLLFDQDSGPPYGMIGQLQERMRCLSESGHRPAVVGPRIVGTHGEAFARPRALAIGSGIAADCIGLEFVISSGSLVDCAAFSAIGGFREDFFIDFIDVEWCVRARALGFSCWTSLETVMTHRLGEGVIKVPGLPVHVTRQPASRAYTFVRNQVAMLRLAHVPPRDKLKTAARLLVQTIFAPAVSQTPFANFAMMLRGWRDGIADRLGPPPR